MKKVVSKIPFKILVVEPFGFPGHRSFNAFILSCLQDIGSVDFVAPSGYMDSYSVDKRVDIPADLLKFSTKLGSRLSAIRVLRFVLRNINMSEYQSVVFLAYETVSFSMCWPANNRTFVFEHNNLDNVIGSLFKEFFYKNISSSVVHIAFQEHIARFIKSKYSRCAVRLPHPYYRSGLIRDESPKIFPVESSSSRDARIIFSPSSSTPNFIQDGLKTFVSSTAGSFYAICKGSPASKDTFWEVCPFFEDYEKIMQDCDFVFFGAHFDYRVSGIAFEALSYGKPLVLFDSLFARELYSENPGLVFIIKEFNDIHAIELDSESIELGHKSFLFEHSREVIQDKLKSFFS